LPFHLNRKDKMLYIEIREDYQTGTYSARVFDGPDGIDDASLTANSLGELFEKITIFRAFNGITYSDDPRDCIRDYFGSIEPAYTDYGNKS